MTLHLPLLQHLLGGKTTNVEDIMAFVKFKHVMQLTFLANQTKVIGSWSISASLVF